MTTSFRQALAERSQGRERRRRQVSRYFWTIYTLVILLTLAYIAVHPIWFIREVKIQNTYSLSPHLLSRIAENHLADKLFYFLPRQSFLFVSKKKIAQDLVAEYPRIHRVKVSIEGLHTLTVTVDERRPTVVGCPSATASTTTSCFYLDQTGVMFEPSPRFSPGVFFTIVSPLISPVNINHQILTPQEIIFLPNFIKQVEKIADDQLATDFLVGDTEFMVHEDVTTRFHYRQDQNNFWEFRFNRETDLSKVLLYFDAAISTEAFQADWLKAPEALEYIDARFGKKIFYRFSTYATSSTVAN